MDKLLDRHYRYEGARESIERMEENLRGNFMQVESPQALIVLGRGKSIFLISSEDHDPLVFKLVGYYISEDRVMHRFYYGEDDSDEVLPFPDMKELMEATWYISKKDYHYHDAKGEPFPEKQEVGRFLSTDDRKELSKSNGDLIKGRFSKYDPDNPPDGEEGLNYILIPYVNGKEKVVIGRGDTIMIPNCKLQRGTETVEVKSQYVVVREIVNAWTVKGYVQLGEDHWENLIITRSQVLDQWTPEKPFETYEWMRLGIDFLFYLDSKTHDRRMARPGDTLMMQTDFGVKYVHVEEIISNDRLLVSFNLKVGRHENRLIKGIHISKIVREEGTEA